MNKNKIFKVIFILSFLPYIILALISLYYAIFGYDVYTWIKPVYTRTIYGMDAFFNSLIWNLLSWIPILILVIIYQIIYTIIIVVKRIKKR